ncbi:serine/threonine/tyrosine protein kinase [Saccharomycopsis crataegensis]|uniref:Serine/threonine/tyrosine protein kinase n=1 Tax=Saccharomycopsis crataegensis TaxID=43959 RepID=A0AAV5QPC2_9ASCO|nr:serine/threonine/tyrosine protein kinase [Saccharomycopsis crataegensis]
MSKGIYDSDEESFFEPPKLSSYSMAILNENKENILADLDNQVIPGMEDQHQPEDILDKDSDSRMMDPNEDNDLVLADIETSSPALLKKENQQHYIQQQQQQQQQHHKRSSLPRKRSTIGIPSRVHNPLGHPRRVSSRKSSGDKMSYKDSNTNIDNENIQKDSQKDNNEAETARSLSSHSQASHEIQNNHNTSTNETSVYGDNIDFKNNIGNPNFIFSHETLVENGYEKNIDPQNALKSKTRNTNDYEEQYRNNHAFENEQELYEQLRKDRLLQEELEKKKMEELERSKKEEHLEQMRLQRELQVQKQIEEERIERDKMLSKQNEQQNQRQQRQQRQQPIEQQQIEQRNSEQRHLQNDRNDIEYANDNKENMPAQKVSFAQKQREAYNVVTETIPLKPEYNEIQQHNMIMVNKVSFEILELIGKGGSSKVYKVKNKSNNKLYALKKVLFDEFDESSAEGFKGEIDLLVKLREKKRVVRLVDYSLTSGCLYLVMECGDVDFARVLGSRLKLSLDFDAVRFYAKELLRCVQEVHDADIVHSDLKPANFLFVKGTLKLIDFGISNVVPDHTVNIYRDSQIGTPNYMAPEALVAASNNNNEGTWKVGKPSDVWSCGCIIYQMIYGRPPYGQYNGHQRILAIMNPEVDINYPDKGLGDVKVPKSLMQLIKSCLTRDPKKRSTIHELLDGPFLNPRIVTHQFLQDLIGSAIGYGKTHEEPSKEELNEIALDVWNRIVGLNY